MARVAIGIASLAVAALALAASAGFGINGYQYQWWRFGCLAIAVESLLIGLVLATRARPAPRISRSRVLVALAGLAALGAAAARTLSRYCDTCGGGLLWPHVFACVGVAGFTLAAAAIVSGGSPAERADGVHDPQP